MQPVTLLLFIFLIRNPGCRPNWGEDPHFTKRWWHWKQNDYPDIRWNKSRSTNRANGFHYDAETWAQRITFGHFMNLTKELALDATYKMTQVAGIKDFYANSMPFQVGYLTASLKEKFEAMLDCYVYLQNARWTANKEYRAPFTTVGGHLNYYLIVQGYYQEILLELKIIDEIVRKAESGEPLETDDAKKSARSGQAKGKKGRNAPSATPRANTKKKLWQPNVKSPAPVPLYGFDYEHGYD